MTEQEPPPLLPQWLRALPCMQAAHAAHGALVGAGLRGRLPVSGARLHVSVYVPDASMSVRQGLSGAVPAQWQPVGKGSPWAPVRA